MKLITTVALALILIAGCKDKRGGNASSQPSGSSSSLAPPLAPPISDASPLVAPGQTGTISLVSAAHAIADLNGDGTDDVVALAEIKSASDEQLRVVALDGKATAFLWVSPRLQPIGEIPKNGRRMVFAGGGRVALATGWKDLQLFDATTGAPTKTLMLDGIPGYRSCVDPEDATHAFLALFAGKTDHSREVGGVMLDLAGASTVPTARPAWCAAAPERRYSADCGLYDNEDREVECSPGSTAPAASNFVAAYVLATKHASVAIGNHSDGRGKEYSDGLPVVLRFDPATKRILWRHEIADAPPQGNYKDHHVVRQADVSPAGVLIVIERVAALQTWGHRLIMLDLKTGEPRFETSIDRPLSRDARVVHNVLYVPRGDSLEARDPATGEVRRHFGSAMGQIVGSAIVPTKTP